MLNTWCKPEGPETVLALGDVAYGKPDGGEKPVAYPPLPGTAQEVRQVRALARRDRPWGRR